MTVAFVATTTNPPDPDLMVKRVLTVAEILSRERRVGDTSEFFVENRAEKHEDEEIGYRETKDQRLHT